MHAGVRSPRFLERATRQELLKADRTPARSLVPPGPSAARSFTLQVTGATGGELGAVTTQTITVLNTDVPAVEVTASVGSTSSGAAGADVLVQWALPTGTDYPPAAADDVEAPAGLGLASYDVKHRQWVEADGVWSEWAALAIDLGVPVIVQLTSLNAHYNRRHTKQSHCRPDGDSQIPTPLPPMLIPTFPFPGARVRALESPHLHTLPVLSCRPYRGASSSRTFTSHPYLHLYTLLYIFTHLHLHTFPPFQVSTFRPSSHES